MTGLVSEREYLCRLCVGSIHEDQRSQRVCQGERSKFVRIECSTGVGTDDSVDHDEDAGVPKSVGETGNCCSPARVLAARWNWKMDCVANDPCTRNRVRVNGQRSNKWQVVGLLRSRPTS